MINFLKSFFSLLSLRFQKDKPMVVFYYPQHFNRGANGKNDFLKPLINSCKNNNIPYLAFEEPAATTAPRDTEAISADALLVLVLALRKLLPLGRFANFEAREWRIGKMLKPLFFLGIKPKIIITMSNSMHGFFRGMDDKADLYDYQHGIIYSWHPGYMIDHKAAEHLCLNKSKVLFFGQGFKQLLTKYDPYFATNGICIGSSVSHNRLHPYFNRHILVTLPFATANETTASYLEIFDVLVRLFTLNQAFYVQHHIVFLLRLHPRFDGTFNLEPILKFPFVHITSGTLSESFEQCSVHLTHTSTTTFEAAATGIPTVFLRNWESELLFGQEYNYPEFNNCTLIHDRIESFMLNQEMYTEAVVLAHEWVKSYYESFDDQKFQKIIHEEN